MLLNNVDTMMEHLPERAGSNSWADPISPCLLVRHSFRIIFIGLRVPNVPVDMKVMSQQT